MLLNNIYSYTFFYFIIIFIIYIYIYILLLGQDKFYFISLIFLLFKVKEFQMTKYLGFGF
jgi:hypothetical protein